MFDFVASWKVISIGLTAAFGILGLMKDFRDKSSGKISKFGYVSLVGIVVSAAFGMTAQVLEDRAAVRDKEETDRRNQAIADAANKAAAAAERSMFNLEKIDINFEVNIDCKHDSDKICSEYKKRARNTIGGIVDIGIVYRIDIFKDEASYQSTLAGAQKPEDLSYLFQGTLTLKEAQRRLESQSVAAWNTASISEDENDKNKLAIFVEGHNMDPFTNTGNIIGIKDLIGTHLILYGPSHNMSLDSMYIKTHSKISSELNLSKCRRAILKNDGKNGPLTTRFFVYGSDVITCDISSIKF